MKTRDLCLLLLLIAALSSCWNRDNPLDPVVNEPVAISAPTFSPAGGTYSHDQVVSIACATSGAIIRYTIDGSEPEASSAQYTNPLSVTTSTSIKAKAFKTGWPESQTATVSYTFQVATPTFNPPGGEYSTGQSVTISCGTPGATIRYTTNGSEPTEASFQYSIPVNVNNTTLKAKAFKTGWISSSTATAAYVIMPSNFVFVSGGTFNNGTSNVTISSFYIDKYELTQAGYQVVMGSNPASGYGVGSNYPVYYASWFNAIEYSNRRSLQEGLTPCYSYSTYGTNPSNWPSGWDTSSTNHTDVSCNWTANGYRLPTEMEWMFAARGGTQTHNYTYSGSNDINAVAWYSSNSGSTTHTVGTKAGNELGTFDMSGNVWEWVWDIYGSYPSGSQTNPTGANSGSNRVARGGGWYDYAFGCTVSDRYSDIATFSYNGLGFRCVRISP